MQAVVITSDIMPRGCSACDGVRQDLKSSREDPRVATLEIENERVAKPGRIRRTRRYLKQKSFQHDLHSVLDNPASSFHEPIKNWSLEQWVIFILLALLCLCLLRCLCGLLRCIIDSFCNVCCGRPTRYAARRTRSGYYYERPPAYNPAYNNNRSSYYAPRSNDCTCFDLLAAACCINCCTNGGNGTASDAFCGLCCFEICCRGGRDVVGGSAVNPSYGAIVV